jgi:hypothetical protein
VVTIVGAQFTLVGDALTLGGRRGCVLDAHSITVSPRRGSGQSRKPQPHRRFGSWRDLGQVALERQ